MVRVRQSRRRPVHAPGRKDPPATRRSSSSPADQATRRTRSTTWPTTPSVCSIHLDVRSSPRRRRLAGRDDRPVPSPLRHPDTDAFPGLAHVNDRRATSLGRPTPGKVYGSSPASVAEPARPPTSSTASMPSGVHRLEGPIRGTRLSCAKRMRHGRSYDRNHDPAGAARQLADGHRRRQPHGRTARDPRRRRSSSTARPTR